MIDPRFVISARALEVRRSGSTPSPDPHCRQFGRAAFSDVG
jgi:hypothetical protein